MTRHEVSRIPYSYTIFPPQRCLTHKNSQLGHHMVTIVTIVTLEYNSLSHAQNNHLFFYLPTLCKTCVFQHRLHNSNTGVLEGLRTRLVAQVSFCQRRARDSPYTLTVFLPFHPRKVSRHFFAAFWEKRVCLRSWLFQSKVATHVKRLTIRDF